jgi:cell division protease FtsH
MTNNTAQNSASQSQFAVHLARAMVRRLFRAEWDGFVEVHHAPAEPDDEDFIATLPDDMASPVSKCLRKAAETRLPDSADESSIAASVGGGDDARTQSSEARERALRKGDPPPSLIAAVLTLAGLVDSEDHLQDLFRPGHVTNLVCPDGAFLWALDQVLPNMIKCWKEYLPSENAVDLQFHVQDDDDDRRLRGRPHERGMADARIERNLAQGVSVLMVTVGNSKLSDGVTALITRRTAWSGLTPEIVIETLRLTHSATGQLSECEIRARLPDAARLKGFTPAQIDAAFAAPTMLMVADRLAEIARKTNLLLPELTLDALHGLGEVRSFLDRILKDLQLWREDALSWSEVTSSAVFHGPPGTGKTTLAKAFAGSAGIPIIATSYSDCQKHGHQGDMLAALDQAFAETKQKAPAVLFIDELDGFSQREGGHHHSSYMRGVVNGLLEQINRASEVEGLILLAATNHLATVDSAVIRSGRFDLKLDVPYPDKGGLQAILAAILGGECPEELCLASIADRLLGQSGAVAEAVVRDAKGRARADRMPVRQKHLESAADQVVPRLDDDTLRRAAIHEAGHVLVMVRLGWPLPKRVCLTAQGGQVEHLPFRMLTPEMAQERLQVLLAGRAAEICVFGTPSSGAGTGVKSAQATNLALAIERQWGFGESGLIWDAATAEETWRVPEDVRICVDRHLSEAEKKALSIVATNKAHVMHLVDRLMRARDLSGPDVERVMQDADVKKLAMASAKAGSSAHDAGRPV